MRDTLVQVQGVSKKFCRSLTRGMTYTCTDVLRDTIGFPSRSDVLRAGEFWAARDVTFELKRGQCLGLIGANGAGKSTLLKLLNGIIRPDVGSITMKGRIGALIEVGAGFHPMLSGRENIYVNGAILGMKKREMDRKLDAIIEFSGLDDAVLDAPVKSYSSGMYVRLGFAIAVQCEPDVLLIDEVLAVGDMSFQAKCLNTLGEIRRSGTTVILVSHNLNHIAGWADCALVMDGGTIAAFGAPLDTIQIYSSLVAKREAERGSLARRANGSGRVRINHVSVLDERGIVAEELHSGRPISVHIEVEVGDPVDDVEVDLKLFDGMNRLASGGSSRYGAAALTLESGRATIVADYPPLPLNGGFIRPSVAIWRGSRSELVDWVECPPIPIVGNAASESDLWWFPEYHVDRVTTSASHHTQFIGHGSAGSAGSHK